MNNMANLLQLRCNLATLHYFHVHNGKGDHADGQTYQIVFVCDDHMHILERDSDAEYIGNTDADVDDCDVCHNRQGYES